MFVVALFIETSVENVLFNSFTSEEISTLFASSLFLNCGCSPVANVNRRYFNIAATPPTRRDKSGDIYPYGAALAVATLLGNVQHHLDTGTEQGCTPMMKCQYFPSHHKTVHSDCLSYHVKFKRVPKSKATSTLCQKRIRRELTRLCRSDPIPCRPATPRSRHGPPSGPMLSSPIIPPIKEWFASTLAEARMSSSKTMRS